MLNRNDILSRLQAHQSELLDMGVLSLELFGSSVRNEMNEASDIDFLVSFDRPVGLFALYEVQEFLEELFPQKKIDLVLRRAVIPEFQDEVYAEAVPCLSETGNSD